MGFAAIRLEPLSDEIHNWLWFLWGERIMALAFLNDNRDPSAELLVSLLGDSRLALEPRIEAATNVEEVHTRVGERGQIIEQLRFCQVAVQDGILAVDATDLVWISDCPGV